MSNTESIIRQAAREFSQCARAVSRRTATLAPSDYEQLVGLGICSDWLGWARLTGLSYHGKRKQELDRIALAHVTRFTFMWTAANAVFARRSLITLLNPTLRADASELEAFSVLYAASALPKSVEAQHLATLNGILSMTQKPRAFPWLPNGTPVTIAHVIFHKYTTDREKRRGIGRKLGAALGAGAYRPLDLPTLIYATRNWTVHGALIATSFRGTQTKFIVYIEAINDALVRILHGAATALRGRL